MKNFKQQLQLCLQRDRRRFYKRWQALKTVSESDPAYLVLTQQMAQSIAAVKHRQQQLPSISFPEELPVSQKADELCELIKQHQVIILAGETGSGKTTQLPKICLQAGRGVFGMIAHTQPRRIAARTVAARMAQELNSELGQYIGFQTRFSENWSENNFIKVMTDGILLAELQTDRYLNQYDTIIIDEAHERSLNIDFLLGYLKQLLNKRQDLKLIITSATIELDRFAENFSNAPIITVEGRTYPVETRYRPLQSHQREEDPKDLFQGIIDAIEELMLEGLGDILVFLTGEGEIRQVANLLRKQVWRNVQVLPLYARLSLAEQQKIFQRGKQRRIVLTTNVAETSITVPGIDYVIDTGLARISQYSYRTKVQRLPIVKISQASAAQRQGRCGRTAPGICIRLYGREDFEQRTEFTLPEILRTNLAAVILQMKAWRLGDLDDFPFIDSPDPRFVRDGYRLLSELQALDQQQQLTSIGKKLATFPIDPCLARIIVAAEQYACLKEILIIISLLSIQDPRERPLEKQQAADEAHARFKDERSDFMTILQLWDFVHQYHATLSRNRFSIFCRENFLSPLRILEWQEVHKQLLQICRELKWSLNDTPVDYINIHHALLTGFIGNVGYHDVDKIYVGARNIKFKIFPNSALYKKTPRWIVAMSLMETSQLFAHYVAEVQPEWIEKVAGHLLKRHYSEPHWEKKLANVLAYEKVTLYGLPLAVQRKVQYEKIDPVLSRELFIRGALVLQEYQTSAEFFKHNQQLITEVEQYEHKSRRRDVLVDEEILWQFFDERLPENIYNGHTFEHWLRTADENQINALFLKKENLMQHTASHITTEQYPKYLMRYDLKLPLSYHFSPNADDDGVTVEIPLVALHQFKADDFSWLVPGMLREKIIEMLRALPKDYRRPLVPIPNFVDEHIEQLSYQQKPLSHVLNSLLKKKLGHEVSAEIWESLTYNDHYKMNFKIVDQQKNILATGRDLHQLKQQLLQQTTEKIQELAEDNWGRSGIKEWDFADLSPQLQIKKNDLTVLVYPSLQDDGDSVSLCLCQTLHQAQKLLKKSLLRLMRLQLINQENYLKKNIPHLEQMALQYLRFGTKAQLQEDFVVAVFQQAFLAGRELIYSKTEFEKCIQDNKAQLNIILNNLGSTALAVLNKAQELNQKLANLTANEMQSVVKDIREHMQKLLFPGFIQQTPAQWLVRITIYLQSDLYRLEKCRSQPNKDQQLQQEWHVLWNDYQRRSSSTGAQAESFYAWQEYRWLLEEYRVSLFAQHLKTVMPVSKKRLENYLIDHVHQTN